jgi:hypothetical protein
MSASLRIALAAVAMAIGGLSPAPVLATTLGADACARHASAAAARSGLTVDVIVRVMRAESRGRPSAVSPRGAMGCMQIMPATWAYLTRHYALGNDPFDARMNMIGGALYLADLARQFGFPGAYSAYNAGPGRYLRYVRGEARLPAETVAYAVQITGSGATPSGSPAARQMPAARWREAGLFMVSPGAGAAASAATSDERRDADGPADRGRADMLFPLTRPAAIASREASTEPQGND